MATVALDTLQALLRERGFASTLPASRIPARPPASSGVEALDILLAGGFARGFLTEISGSLSAGVTSVAFSVVAAATARGEAVAYIDATDSFHPESASQSGVDQQRLLLVRCRGPREAWDAVNLVVAAGGFGLIVLDLLGTASPRQLREWQARPWLKLQRSIENTSTTLAVLSPWQTALQQSGLCAQVPVARLELLRKETLWCGQDGVSLALCGLESVARMAYQRSISTGDRFATGKRPPRKEPQCSLRIEAYEPEYHTQPAAS